MRTASALCLLVSFIANGVTAYTCTGSVITGLLPIDLPIPNFPALADTLPRNKALCCTKEGVNTGTNCVAPSPAVGAASVSVATFRDRCSRPGGRTAMCCGTLVDNNGSNISVGCKSAV